MKEEKSKISFSEFRDPDFQRLAGLTAKTYPGREIADAGYLNWEYLQNPDGKALVCVAEDEKTVVSQYLVLPRWYRINGSPVKGSLSVNTLTHPDYRGKGLFPKLAEMTYENAVISGIAFTAGFPNPISSPVFAGKLKFTTAGYMPFYAKPLRPFQVLKKYILRKEVQRGAEPALQFADDRSGANTSFHISVFNPETDAFIYQDFLERFLSHKINCALRDLNFIKWRYVDIPLRRYHLFKIVVDQRMEALVIIRSAELFGLKTILVMELLFSHEENSAQAANHLLQWVSGQASGNAMDLVVIARQDSSGWKLPLLRQGFFPVPKRFLPQPLEFILRAHNEQLEQEYFFDFRNWYLNLGDSDVF
ncbi:MAG TPA: GNAT family N-acetyltransferase [Bacteroidia bacterium]|nr:GNAT family N-acetyltransferase [Bacteroidia bacterium]